MTKPICSFMPTSNLIVQKSQITLDLVSKDVEKVVFQKMRKIFASGRVNDLTFMFSVSSKVRVYENLKDIFQKGEKSDTVVNQSELTLDLSSKNVKNAFFEFMTSHQNERRTTSLAFTFILLSEEHIYEEVSCSRESNGYAETPPPLPSLMTHPAKRSASNSLYGLVTRRKNPLRKIMGLFNKCFPKRSFPIPQARYTSYAFDSGFECDVSVNKAPTIEKEHIYEAIRERKLSEENSGYETIPSPS
ncbi:MAG: hypothetical protein C5B45_00225 [Chlamydiae bacterium]|nr:MAG: hypothetical protein C5B45_00225 [Chlamydiota bacterium]